MLDETESNVRFALQGQMTLSVVKLSSLFEEVIMIIK